LKCSSNPESFFSSLHANVWVSAHDRAGVERLCRYVLRPPFALELKRAWHDGTRELVFEPPE